MAKRNSIPITSDVPGVNEGQRAFIRKVIRTALAAEGMTLPCEIDVRITNDTGIHEKRIFGKGLEIAWKDLSEYVCELTGSPHRNSASYYYLLFSATEIAPPVIIRTAKFSEAKKSHFRNTVFSFCDKHQQK